MLVGSPLGGVELEIGEQHLPVADVRLEDSYGKVRKNREELQARLHAVRSSREGVRPAKKQYWPDLTLLIIPAVGFRISPFDRGGCAWAPGGI